MGGDGAGLLLDLIVLTGFCFVLVASSVRLLRRNL